MSKRFVLKIIKCASEPVIKTQIWVTTTNFGIICVYARWNIFDLVLSPYSPYRMCLWSLFGQLKPMCPLITCSLYLDYLPHCPRKSVSGCMDLQYQPIRYYPVFVCDLLEPIHWTLWRTKQAHLGICYCGQDIYATQDVMGLFKCLHLAAGSLYS